MSIGHSTQSVRSLLLTLALMLLAAAHAQPTVAELEREVRQQPGNVDAWINLGNAQLAAKSFEAAKDSFLEATSLDYRAGDAHFGLGLAEYGRGDYQAALFAFNEVTRLYPERFDGHYNRGVTLVRLRRAPEAVEAFRTAIAEAQPEAGDADLINAYIGLAGQLKIGGAFGEAAAAYEAALERKPGDLELALLRADALHRAGRGLEALPALTDLETTSSDYRVSSLIADVYVEAGQVDYALRSLERALRKSEAAGDQIAQANLLVKLGLLQRELGRDAAAGASFARAAQANPAAWEAHYNLGVSYLESGQPRSALGPLERAVELKADSGEAHLALASAFDQLLQTPAALASARTALDLLQEPALAAQARFIHGRALYRQGDYLGASSDLEQVVAVQPSNAAAQLWAGLAQYQQGNFRAAVQYYERAVQLEPSNVEARINLGAAYLATERYADAELIYAQLVEQNPGDAESFYNLGWALLSQSDRTAARDAWQKSQSLGYAPAAEALRQYFQ